MKGGSEKEHTAVKLMRPRAIKEAARIVGVNPAQISTACVTGQRCADQYWKKEEG